MNIPRTTAAFDVVRVVDTLAAIVQAASLEPVSERRTATLHQLDRLAAEFLHWPDGSPHQDVLDRFADWIHQLDDPATKSRLASVLSHCARYVGRTPLAGKLRVRALNQAEQVTDPIGRARSLLAVAEQLGDVDQDDSLHEAVQRAESTIHDLPESEHKRELTVAVAHALAAIGQAQEAANELQAALLPGSKPFTNGSGPAAKPAAPPTLETPEGRFTDPTAGLLAPKAHRRPR